MKIPIETKRLIIRELDKNDSEAFSKNGSDPEINYFNWYLPYPLPIEKAKKIIEKRRVETNTHRWLYELAIVLKETKEFIGILSLYDVSKPDKKAKIGYWIGKNYRKRGYAKEAISEIISYAFKELNLNKISAKTMIDNKASIALLENQGFRKVGVLMKDKIIDNKEHDVIEWEKLNPEI